MTKYCDTHTGNVALQNSDSDHVTRRWGFVETFDTHRELVGE